MGTERIVVAAVAGIALGLSVFAVLKPSAGPAGDAAFGEKVKSYLMANPNVLFEAAASYEQQEMAKSQEKIEAAIAENKDKLPALPGEFYAGNPNAEITVVEFFDYHCAYCKTALPALMDLVEENKDVRVRFMEFPILRPESELASRAAIAANAQGKYLPFHQAMMSAPGVLSMERIFAIAQDVGIDLEQLRADMEAEKTTEILDAHRSFAEEIGFDGTPGLIVGDKAITGWSEETLHQFIAEQRKQKS
jgi:protein-disulfide isomerase